jgi:hypothetical protein
MELRSHFPLGDLALGKKTAIFLKIKLGQHVYGVPNFQTSNNLSKMLIISRGLSKNPG